jgi:hypothetical protein
MSHLLKNYHIGMLVSSVRQRLDQVMNLAINSKILPGTNVFFSLTIRVNIGIAVIKSEAPLKAFSPNGSYNPFYGKIKCQGKL